MTDDLVKRLRGEVILERFEGGHVSQMRNPDGPEAADRIEKLAAELVRTFNNMMGDAKRIEKLEAALLAVKLTSVDFVAVTIAVEALEGKDD